MGWAMGLDVIGDVASEPPRWRSPVRRRLWGDALDLAGAESLGLGAYSFGVVSVETEVSEAAAGPVLRAGAHILNAPRLRPAKGTLTAVACGVATLGPALEQRVQALFGAGRGALAVALDELGNALLSAVSRRMEDRIRRELRRSGLSIAGELRPGDPGLAIGEQAAVVDLAAGGEVGVIVYGGAMMRPLKSLSVVYGVGVGLEPAEWSRCDVCPSRLRGRCSLDGTAGRCSTETAGAGVSDTAGQAPPEAAPA